MRYSEELDSCQESQICHQREVTWEQGPIRALVSIALQRNLMSAISWARAEHQLWAIGGYYNNSRFQKAQRPSGSFIKYFYFSLYDIGMARKSAHRFVFHDFHNFKALNACAAQYFCLYRRIQGGGWGGGGGGGFVRFLPSKLGKPL